MQTSFTNTISTQTINLDLTNIKSNNVDISTLCTDLFLIIIKMREAEDLGEPSALRKLQGYRNASRFYN